MPSAAYGAPCLQTPSHATFRPVHRGQGNVFALPLCPCILPAMYRRSLAAVGIALVQFLLISCAHRPPRMSYQLQQQSGDSVLVPPESGRWRPGEVLHFHLRRNRGARDCATPAGMLQLSLHRSSAALTADFKDVVIDGRLRFDALSDIDRFRSGLHQLEAQGCLPAGGSDMILRRLQESIATPPAVAVFLRYGIYPVNGAMDLIPGMRLKAERPLRTCWPHPLSPHQTKSV